MRLWRTTRCDVNVAALRCTATDSHEALAMDVLDDALSMFVAAVQVVAAFLHIQAKYCDASECPFEAKGNSLKPDLVNAFAWTSSVLDSVEGPKGRLGAMKQQSLAFMQGSVFHTHRSWFASARDALHMAAQLLHGKILSSTLSMSKDVENLTPRYAHLFQKTVNPLAKRILLQAPGRSKLMEYTLALHGRIAIAAEWQTRWKISSPAFDEDIMSLQNVFRAAKSALLRYSSVCRALGSEWGEAAG